LVRFAPGFESDEEMTDYRLSRATRDALRKGRSSAGNPVQYYVDYLSGIVRGDFGRSIVFGQPVGLLIRQRAVTTLATVALGLFFGWVAALVAAMTAAMSRWSGAELTLTLASSSLASVPSAIVATFCVL